MALLPTRAEIDDAAALLARYFPPSRLLRVGPVPDSAAELWLKLEQELPTGSFKVRGALVALHAAVQRGTAAGGVVAASTGNHGAAVAWAARTLGVPATIFLPCSPNQVKRGRIMEHGARIVETGSGIAEARRAAAAFAAASGAFVLDDATDPHLPAGPATIGREILADLPAAASVVVPVGDTALIRGVASALKAERPDIRVVGVQAATANAYERAWRTGTARATRACATIADGLATRVPDPANVRAIRAVVDDMVTVTDAGMLCAMRRLLRTARVLAEPAAAASVAALARLDVAGPAVALITGANVPPAVLALLLEGP
jgi:threonine dehydratase